MTGKKRRQHPNEKRSQAGNSNSSDIDKEEGSIQHGAVGGAPEQCVDDADQKHNEANQTSDKHK